MKILQLILILGLALNTSCDKNDDPSPIEQLPPATQTGAQTFGCLINGEAFVPALFGRNSPRAFYQFVRGAHTFNISGRRDKDGKLYSVAIGGIDVQPLEETTYSLIEEETGNRYGEYKIDGGLQYNGITSTQNPGKLYIDHLDEEKGIISGRFEFTVYDNNGNEIKITDGRFDMNYTN